MNNPNPYEFSFDTFPGLDAELDAAYAQPDMDDRLGVPGLAGAVTNVLGQHTEKQVDQNEVEGLPRANHELEMAFLHWEKYNNRLLPAMPRSLDQLRESHTNLNQTLAHLLRAREDLNASGELTPDGQKLGYSMHLVLMPWQAIQHALAPRR